MRIKAVYIKNLGMSENKMASQIAHAVKNLGRTPPDCTIIVLGVSRKKFGELVEANKNCYIQKDLGHTEVKAGTATAAAWIEVEEEKCDILYPRNDFDVIDKDGCIMKDGHDGAHIFKHGNGELWSWEYDEDCKCGCWDNIEEDHDAGCILYGKIK